MGGYELKKGSERLILPYPESLYNICILSFNNIKGERALELSEIHRQLKTLERRGAELSDEIKAIGVEGLALHRRALASHTDFRLRIGTGSKREYVQVGDERLKAFIAGQPEDLAAEIVSHASELVILNANLKVYWTVYLEMGEARRLFGDPVELVKPSTILESTADSTGNAD